MTDAITSNLITFVWVAGLLLIVLMIALLVLLVLFLRNREHHQQQLSYVLKYFKELDRRVAASEALARALTRDIGMLKARIHELLTQQSTVTREPPPEPPPPVNPLRAEFELDPSSRHNATKRSVFQAASAIASEDVEYRTNTPHEKPSQTHLPIVMIVDDSRTAQRVAKMSLEQHGFHVVLANDGLDALQKLQAELPDIIVTDLEMPRMDGLELIARVREDERLVEVPVVVVSSVNPVSLQDKMKNLNINYFLIKPYSRDSLISVVRQLTGALSSQAAQ